MKYNTVIVGGGVAGASTAIHLAQKTDPESILLVDKNHHYDKACSGILTFAVDDWFKIPKDVIVSRVNRFRIFSPNNDFLEVKFRNPDIVCERELLNEFLNNKAHDLGVNVLRPAVFEGISHNKVLIKDDKSTKDISALNLVGADGSQSSVAKAVGLFKNRNFFIGAKAIIKKEHDNVIDVFANVGLFAWAVPHGEGFMEVGSMSYPHQGAVFDRFLKRFDCKVVSKSGALIPVHQPFVKTHAKFNDINTYLVGDAATMVKATTGGSIVQSFIASRFLADCIINNKNYGLAWRRNIGLDLLTHLRIRKFLDKLSEKDWNDLIAYFQDEKLKEVLETKSRDYSFSLILKTLISKPAIIKFAPKMF